jgi:hypothetical protein
MFLPSSEKIDVIPIFLPIKPGIFFFFKLL